MIEQVNDGGPAFPVQTRPCENGFEYGHQCGPTTVQYGGMTIRDYFAIRAPVECVNAIAGETVSEVSEFLGLESEDQYDPGFHWAIADCKARYIWADHMLTARTGYNQ
jgi:hypothetical protein